MTTTKPRLVQNVESRLDRPAAARNYFSMIRREEPQLSFLPSPSPNSSKSCKRTFLPSFGTSLLLLTVFDCELSASSVYLGLGNRLTINSGQSREKCPIILQTRERLVHRSEGEPSLTTIRLPRLYVPNLRPDYP